ncbi:MAG: FAD-dependent oxidoreductase [Bacteroidota bacterium]
MFDKIIKILTSYKKPQKTCPIGNEAIARGAIEAGVQGVFAYPGTPSTEISEVFNHVSEFQNDPGHKKKFPELTSNPIYFEYSVNEKVALEKAIAYTIGNKSAMCCMKNVGMNVASDPLMSITYQTICAPLVIVVCDDPGCHSSSNEQDSRYWGKMASVPVFNPAFPEDAYSMTKDAFVLSGKLKLPVIVRMTTRVSHSRGMVFYNEFSFNNQPGKFEKMPGHINIPARTATAHQKLLEKLYSNIITPFFEKHNIELSKSSKTFGKLKFLPSLCIISSGVSSVYLSEILYDNKLTGKIKVLKLGLIHPFPENNVIPFLKSVTRFQTVARILETEKSMTRLQAVPRILVLEELDPIVEDQVRVIAQKHNIDCNIFGKGFSSLATTGEFSIDIVKQAVEEFVGQPLKRKKELPPVVSLSHPPPEKVSLVPALSGVGEVILPPRPPSLCPGCPHRATFYALKLSIPRDNNNVVLCGDIGCFGLGALPPIQMIDTIHHMGMSISMAQGLSEALCSSSTSGKWGGAKTIALIGDGTFFHSGIASMMNAVYTNANIMVVIFDNRTIGMTGGQDHPGASRSDKYREIDIPPLLKGMGIQYVETIDPFDVKNSYEKIRDASLVKGVSVIVSTSPCIFHPDHKTKIPKNAIITVDHNLCTNCGNHLDHTLPCSRTYSPGSNLRRAKAKISAEYSIPGEMQPCPANICNHSFFYSIMDRNYKSALEIVKDKILFARTCGDICHRPCELYTGKETGPVVPVKQLKKFVSSIDENFYDFSALKERVKSSEKKNKDIAIVGAGPAGLSAAYDLIQAGYKVTVFEKEKQGGGLIRYAIPDFRMDKKGFDFEVSQLGELGVKFKYNISLGKDISLDKLTGKYDGVILATGMPKSLTLDIIEENIPREKRFDALSFLREYYFKTLELNPASSILLIGGGNSAIDAARTAKRLDSKNRVIVSCIETTEEMPAFAEEIEHAVEEGIELVPDSFVEHCPVKADGKISFKLSSFKTKKHLQKIVCDYVIVAIGQRGDKTLFSGINSLQFDKDIRIKIEKKNGLVKYKKPTLSQVVPKREGQIQSEPVVFVAGDACSGNHISVIGAIASGKRAAIGIRQLLEDYSIAYEGQDALDKLNVSPNNIRSKVNPNNIRINVDPNDIRINEITQNISQQLQQFDLYQACYWCNHCIDNFGCPAMTKVDAKVVIDETICNLCGLCIDVCPNRSIQWVEKKNLTS